MTTAITTQAKTAWYIPLDGWPSQYTDAQGHIWFSKTEAMRIGRELRILPVRSSSGGIKTVVTGYREN